MSTRDEAIELAASYINKNIALINTDIRRISLEDLHLIKKGGIGFRRHGDTCIGIHYEK
jgi:hypothetical protein